MKHIKQKNQLDCGIACAAMLAGTTYKTALSCDKNPISDTGLNLSEMSQMLLDLTGSNWKPSKKHFKKVLKDIKLEESAILIQNKDDFAHWIASDGVHIFDPWFNKKLKVEDYEYKTWVVLRTLNSTPIITT